MTQHALGKDALVGLVLLAAGILPMGCEGGSSGPNCMHSIAQAVTAQQVGVV